VRAAEGVDLGDLPAVELGAVELERLARAERGGIERLAVPFDAQARSSAVGWLGCSVANSKCTPPSGRRTHETEIQPFWPGSPCHSWCQPVCRIAKAPLAI
jgi:hypothetical protein